MNRLYELLEQGVYSPEVFAQRSALVDEKRQRAQIIQQRLQDELSAIHTRQGPALPSPSIANILQAYSDAPTPADQNKLLKGLLDHIDYSKTTRGLRSGAGSDAFELTLYPLLPP